jgi:hypothetical protein
VFEAAPEKETMIITGRPSTLIQRLSKVSAVAVLVLLGAAGGIYYYGSMGGQWISGLPGPALQPQQQAPLVTMPQTTAPAPSALTPVVTTPSSTPVSRTAITPAVSTPTSTRVIEKKKGPAPDRKSVSSSKKKKKKPPSGTR